MKLSVIMDGHNYFNFLNCTIVQGLKNLGHEVYSFNGDEENYCTPWEGQRHDMVIQAWGDHNNFPDETKPRVYLFGEDTGIWREPTFEPNYSKIGADAYFIRDFRGSPRFNCFPMNFGIEDRYYCITDKKRIPLKDREYDVVFLGRFDNCKHRRTLLEEIRDGLKSLDYNVLIDDPCFCEPDDKWSKWIKGHCVHDVRYFKTLANAKILLSPMGFGPDTARTWEAFASGGIPLIQYMPTTMVPPRPRDGLDCLFFNTAKQAIERVKETLEDIRKAQIIANTAFKIGREWHTTKARASYMLDIMKRIGLLENV